MNVVEYDQFTYIKLHGYDYKEFKTSKRVILDIVVDVVSDDFFYLLYKNDIKILTVVSTKTQKISIPYIPNTIKNINLDNFNIDNSFYEVPLGYKLNQSVISIQNTDFKEDDINPHRVKELTCSFFPEKLKLDVLVIYPLIKFEGDDSKFEKIKYLKLKIENNKDYEFLQKFKHIVSLDVDIEDNYIEREVLDWYLKDVNVDKLNVL